MHSVCVQIHTTHITLVCVCVCTFVQWLTYQIQWPKYSSVHWMCLCNSGIMHVACVWRGTRALMLTDTLEVTSPPPQPSFQHCKYCPKVSHRVASYIHVAEPCPLNLVSVLSLYCPAPQVSWEFKSLMSPISGHSFTQQLQRLGTLFVSMESLKTFSFSRVSCSHLHDNRGGGGLGS